MKFTTRFAVALAAALFLVAPAQAQQVLRSQTVSFDNYTALKAVPSARFSEGAIAIVAEKGRGGAFVMDKTTDYSALASSDPLECLVIDMGSGSYWVRQEWRNAGSQVDVTWCGALPDDATDDTTAIQAALDITQASAVFVPAGAFDISDPLVISRDTVSLYGVGRESEIRQSQDEDVIQIDTDTPNAILDYIDIHDLYLRVQTASGNPNGPVDVTTGAGIHVLVDTLVSTGVERSTFRDLWFHRVQKAIAFDKSALIDYLGIAQIDTNRFNRIDGIRIVPAGETDYGVWWEGGSNGHNMILNSHLRGAVSGIKAGDGLGDTSVGDFIISNNHIVSGDYCVDIYGPATAGRYNRSTQISNNQFDGCGTNTVRIRNMSDFRIFNNSSMSGVGMSVDTSNSDYIIDDRGDLTLRGLMVDAQAGETDRIIVTPGVSSAPTIGVSSPSANRSLDIEAKGSGSVFLPKQRTHYMEFKGCDTSGCTVTITPAGGTNDEILRLQKTTNGHIEVDGHFRVFTSVAPETDHTGTTAETVLATVTIPGGYLGANGVIRITSVWSATDNANTKTARIKFGASGEGTSGVEFYTLDMATKATLRQQTQIMNNGSASAQIAGPKALSESGFGLSDGLIVTDTTDTASDVDVIFTAQLANSADTISLEAYTIEILKR